MGYFYITMQVVGDRVVGSSHKGWLDSIRVEADTLLVREKEYCLSVQGDQIDNNIFSILSYRHSLLCFTFMGQVLILDHSFKEQASGMFNKAVQLVECDYQPTSQLLCVAF